MTMFKRSPPATPPASPKAHSGQRAAHHEDEDLTPAVPAIKLSPEQAEQLAREPRVSTHEPPKAEPQALVTPYQVVVREPYAREALARLLAATPPELSTFMQSASAEQLHEYYAARVHARAILES